MCCVFECTRCVFEFVLGCVVYLSFTRMCCVFEFVLGCIVVCIFVCTRMCI